VTTST